MSKWEVLQEEASIVLVGNFNPSIFHPEWFIRKEIVEEWDYKSEQTVTMHDLSQIQLPNDRELSVLLNKFVLKTRMASNHLALKDIVSSTFSILKETPLIQLGMNYSQIIKITDKEDWLKFGSELAPQHPWIKAADYIDSNYENKDGHLGLWDMTMNLPRPDDYKGYIRPKINALEPAANQTFLFNVNNHINIEDGSAIDAVKMLEECWEDSLTHSHNIIENILKSQIG